MKWQIFIAVTILATLSHSEDVWTPSPLCPYPSENLTRFPYEGDCTRFWECYEGARYIMTCAQGLEYNEAYERCDAPQIARCVAHETIIYPTFAHNDVPATQPGTTASPDPLCPFSEIIVFYPYPYNCSQYWECFEGKRYLMNCPRNLYWNIKYTYCDYLDNVDCSLNSNPVTVVTPPTAPTAPPTDVGPLCPTANDQIVYFPYSLNCSQYWECYEGSRYLMTCPSNLFWNEVANVCDYLENVNCDRSQGQPTVATPPTAPSVNTTIGSTSPAEVQTPAPPTTLPPESLCAHATDGTYIGNPANCRQFFECDTGRAILEQCPGNLLWNQDKLSCDFPINVDCVEV